MLLFLLSIFACAAGGLHASASSSECGTVEIGAKGGELVSHKAFGACPYPVDLSCEWEIKADEKDENSRILFWFKSYEMPVEPKPCTRTYLKFFDPGSTNALQDICHGRQTPPPFNSTGSVVKATFKTSDFGAKGFRLVWKNFRICDPLDFTCADGSCIHIRYRCGQDPQCPDGGDLKGCATCDPKTQYTCANLPQQKCIDKAKRCDGKDDCGNRFDELGCATCDAKTQFKCSMTPKQKCLDNSKLCDGVDDCGNNEDESGCQKCTATQIRCKNRWQCVDASAQCNTVADCSDGSDELSCLHNRTDLLPPCNPNNVFCRVTKLCIRASLACNGVKDCGNDSDLSDEENCLPGGNPCGEWRQCDNSQYVAKEKWCDKTTHCSDNSDEKNCP